MKINIKKEIREWVVCIIIALIAYFVINYFIGTIAGVKQTSMTPTVKHGERVIIERRVLYNKQILRGDIVIIEAPNDSNKLDNDNDNIQAKYSTYKGFNKIVYNFLGLGKISYIKRVIGFPGEHLYISEEGQVYINDKLLEEPYLAESTKTIRSGAYFDVVIPKGCVFVMGDNREGSRDSREFGAIPINKVEGKVRIRIWPLNKIGKI